MQLKTLLNRVYKLPGFVYGKIRLVPAGKQGGRDRLEVEVRPRAGTKARCSGCGKPGPGYDRLRPRRFQVSIHSGEYFGAWEAGPREGQRQGKARIGEGAARRCRVASLAAFRLQPEKVGE